MNTLDLIATLFLLAFGVFARNKLILSDDAGMLMLHVPLKVLIKFVKFVFISICTCTVNISDMMN